jgi:HSP20 family molecular chaperone IbpA
MNLAALFFSLAASFWESKAPADWTDDELVRMFTDSPWGQMVQPSSGKDSHGAPVQIYIASAGLMQEAEKERRRRYVRKGNAPVEESPMEAEYRLWMEDNRATQIVLAIHINRGKDFDDASQTKRMESDSIMRVGRKRFKMTGNFPPTTHDTYLRMAFPREVRETDNRVTFELYLPGVSPPYRTVEFAVKDMIVKGKLEL